MATVGRKKRKRKAGSRTGVTVKPHTRSPRGPNNRKRPVRVDPYQRGKPRKARTSGTRSRRRRRKRR